MKQNYFLNSAKIFVTCLVAINSLQSVQAQDGSLDTSFNPGVGFAQDVFSTAVQNDGKIVVVGNFTSSASMIGNRIVRLNADGSQDTSFNTGNGFSNDVRGVTLQPDGKVIVVGEFTTFNDVVRNRIVRLNTNGSLDTTFDPGVGFNFYAHVPIVQTDGKIIVVGSFTGTSRNYIARLNSDGSLDTTFNTGTGFNNNVYTATLQPDGKLIVGGNFSNYNGVARAKIARLNSDGSLDTSFSSGTTGFNNFVFALSVQTDNKIIVGGWFTTFNGTARKGITRLNTDGSLDTNFNPGTGFNSNVYATKIQTDGKIVVAGDYTSFNGTTRNNICRLNTDGTLDTNFNVGTAFNSYVRSLSIQSDGKIIAGGFFTSYNGTTRTRIARINVPSLTVDNQKLVEFKYYPNPTSNYLNIKSNKSFETITIANLIGQEVKRFAVNSNEAVINIENVPVGIYVVTMQLEGFSESFKITKN